MKFACDNKMPEEFLTEVDDILKLPEFRAIENYRHHNHTNRLEHSIGVSYMAWRLSGRLGGNRRITARAGLLHDFCPYDFADRTVTREHQAFYHPKAAVKNSREYFSVSNKELSIIRTHMFPVGPFPRYRESWIVILADKLCTIAEYCNIPMAPAVYGAEK